MKIIIINSQGVSRNDNLSHVVAAAVSIILKFFATFHSVYIKITWYAYSS